MEIFITIIVVLIIIVLAVHQRNENKHKKLLRELWNDYQQALLGSDKNVVLQKGRLFFSKSRGGYLTAIDEQSLANDLAAMSVTSKTQLTNQQLLTEHLAKLKAQLDDGTLTPEEYQQLKNKAMASFD